MACRELRKTAAVVNIPYELSEKLQVCMKGCGCAGNEITVCQATEELLLVRRITRKKWWKEAEFFRKGEKGNEGGVTVEDEGKPQLCAAKESCQRHEKPQSERYLHKLSRGIWY